MISSYNWFLLIPLAGLAAIVGLIIKDSKSENNDTVSTNGDGD